MSHALPDGWRWAKLGEFLTQKSRWITVDDSQYYKRCTVSWYNKGIFLRDELIGAKIKTKRQQVIAQGDFVVAEIDAKEGSFGIVKADTAGSVVSSHYFVFVVAESLDPDFFEQCISTGILQSQVNAVGSTNYAAIRPDEVYTYRIPLPPLDEQQRIAAVLRDADASVARVEETIRAAQEVKRGVMRRLFRYGIGGKDTPTQHTAVGEIPAGWSVVELGNVASIGSGTTPNRGIIEYWTKGTVPWVKTGEINYLLIQATEEYITEKALSEIGLRVYPPGTILMAMYGQGATRGKVAMLGIAATINQACAAINTHAHLLESFAYFYLSFQYNELRTLSHGSNQANLNSQLIAAFPFPLPPLEEQREIAAVLHSHDEAIRATQAEADRLRELKRGLMQGLLSGEIRTSP